jgi:tetratricopeptide (TPR) repeat protein
MGVLCIKSEYLIGVQALLRACGIAVYSATGICCNGIRRRRMSVQGPESDSVEGGESITAYCDRHHLPVRARLELFVRVCDLVQDAHTKGMILRHITPFSVRVGLKDGNPIPAVTGLGATGKTLTDASLDAPQYTSPDQAGANPDDGDARSDIYSLGVLLYELLSGLAPLDPQTLRSVSAGERQRIICEVDPPPPSAKLESLDANDATRLAQLRCKAVPALAGELRRELEWIPLKAIRKDRAERYRTAAELADDVRNYLTGEPLIAGPHTPSYKLGKFVSRNRARVITASAAAAVVLASVVVSFVMIARARNAALAARDQAQARSSRAEAHFALANDAVRQFSSTVSERQRPLTPQLERLRGPLRESMVKYWEKLRDQIGDDSRFQREQLDAGNLLADFAMDAGDLKRAQALLSSSLAGQRQLAASNPGDEQLQRELAASLSKLGLVMHRLDKPDDARRHFDESGAILHRLLEAHPNDEQLVLDRAMILDHLGMLLRDLRQLEQSEESYKQALAMQQRIAGKPGPLLVRAQEAIADTSANLGLLLEDQKKLDQAIEHFARAARARQAVAEVNSEDRVAAGELATAVSVLGEAQLRHNHPDEGRANLMKAKQLWHAMIDDPRLRELSRANAQAYAQIAWLELLVGEPKRALESANRAELADPELPEVRLNRAHALMFSGKVDEARQVYRENWLQQIPPGGTFAERALEDFATLRRFNREHPAMRQIEAEMMPVSSQ